MSKENEVKNEKGEVIGFLCKTCKDTKIMTFRGECEACMMARLKNGATVVKEQTHQNLFLIPKYFRVIVTDETTDQIVYDKSSKAGIICNVEDYTISKEEPGRIDGVQQHYYWGHPALWVHVQKDIDQNIQQILAQDPNIVQAIKNFFGL